MIPRAYLLVPLAAVLLLAACGDSDAPPASQGRAGGPPGGRAVVVATAAVSRGAIEEQATYVAELRARSDVQLAAEVNGQVRSVHAELGDRVKKGQVLARIDPRTFRQALREAEAQVALARAAVGSAEVEHETARRDHERKAPLLERGLLSQYEWDTVDARLRAADSALATARAQLAQAAARQERARIDQANTDIVAPFDGVVAAREVDAGALVSPGTAVFRVADVDRLVLRFAAPEKDVIRLQNGQEVAVLVEAVPGEARRGAVERISPVVDPETRTTPVEVVLENDGLLKPGMFARVSVTLASRDDALLVPAQAVVRRQDAGEAVAREGVFVIQEGAARFVPVQVGLRNREQVEIARGVEAGAAVITAGHADLRDGAPVRVVGGEETQAAEAAAGPAASGATPEAARRPAGEGRGS